MPVVSTSFSEVASIDYPILDADAHVNEPPDTWQARVPAKLRERAPKVVHTDDGDMWSFDDGKSLRPVGLTATAGLSYLQYRPSRAVVRDHACRLVRHQGAPRRHGCRRDLAPGAVPERHARSARRSTATSRSSSRRASARTTTGSSSSARGRRAGSSAQAILSTTGVDAAIAETERAIGLGHRGVVISAFPNGTLDPAPEDDRFWAFAQEADIPVAVHIGSFLKAVTSVPPLDSLAFMGVAGASKAGAHTLPVVCDLIFSGIFERFPSLKLLLVEANIGWIPTLLEQVDDMYLRYRWFTNGVEQMPTMPSRIFHRNFWATFMVDTVGIELRHRLNVDHLMWSTDYPHTGTEWPNNRISIERNFRGVERETVKKMLHDNCRTLYKLDHVPDSLA